MGAERYEDDDRIRILIFIVLPPHCSATPATSQQSRELDVVMIQVDPLDTGQSCVAEESLQVVSHPGLAIGQSREGQRGVIA